MHHICIIAFGDNAMSFPRPPMQEIVRQLLALREAASTPAQAVA